MKTEVYSWRLSAQKKAELETKARREGMSLAGLLDEITTHWLRQQHSTVEDDTEQAAIRKHAASAIGAVRGDDPTRASRASELVREIILEKHLKESHASRRPD